MVLLTISEVSKDYEGKKRAKPHRFEGWETANPNELSVASCMTNAMKQILTSGTIVSETLRSIVIIECKKSLGRLSGIGV
jgi:citrate lyase synthetase